LTAQKSLTQPTGHRNPPPNLRRADAVSEELTTDFEKAADFGQNDTIIAATNTS
jgi:hypothetical protein